jgi:carbonic anhydrase
MRLFEAILDANHRAVAGDASAGLRPADYADSLPIVALTCVDPRLNAFFPNVLALPAEDFIWLRNAGNIVTGILTSTMRSLALSCAVKGGREIAIIGHSDCQICKTTTIQLLDKLKAIGVDRHRLPENINEFFGTFGSERQNVIKGCDFVRSSPLIGLQIPVHGLLLDLETGRLEWIVNGYQTLTSPPPPMTPSALPPQIGDPTDTIGSFKEFALGEMSFPQTKIGELATHIENLVSDPASELGSEAGRGVSPAAQPAPPPVKPPLPQMDAGWTKPPPMQVKASPLPPIRKAPLPPPIRPRANLRRG